MEFEIINYDASTMYNVYTITTFLNEWFKNETYQILLTPQYKLKILLPIFNEYCKQ